MRRRLLLSAAALAAVLLASAALGALRPPAGPPASADFATSRLSEGGLFRVSFESSQAPVPVNQLHSWTLHVETPGGQPVEQAEIRVAGDMPEHGHGMPTRPQVTQALGNGDYLVEGMKFQMGGYWVIAFEITAAGQTDQVSFELMLPGG